jgi:single-strand DNA-binding protein
MTGDFDVAGSIVFGGFMNNLNSVLIEGILTKDPQFRTTTTGKNVCSLSIASHRYYKQATGVVVEEVSFFDITTWSKLAESCNTLGHKGRGVKIVGSLTQDRWTDPEGKPRSKVKIVAEHVEFRPEYKREATVQGAFAGADAAAWVSTEAGVPTEAWAPAEAAVPVGAGAARESALLSAEEMAAVTF